MKRKILSILSILVLMACFSCASQTPWRRATVTTFELVGATVEQTKPTVEVLYANKVISDAKLGQIKEIYNKAIIIYGKAGQTLKLAGQTEDVIKRDALLSEYEKLLAEFKNLSLEIHKLITQK